MVPNFRNILVSLCGTSPAVITEAIWALADDGVKVDTVEIITTTEGKAAINNQLFGEQNNLAKLRKLLPEKYAQFKFSNTGKYINILSNADDSGDSSDIQQTNDALPTGNDILNILRKYTENPDTKIYFSIAGGRKSMTAMGALCLSLVGREQDELCHVLVNDKLVSGSPKFYFPSNLKHICKPFGSKVEEEIDGSTAKITLATIPYVRIRNLFQEKFDSIPTYYSELVEQANTIALGKKPKKKLVIDTKECSVTIDGKVLKMTDRPFAYLYTLSKHGKVITKGKYSIAEDTHELVVKYSSNLGINIQTLIEESSFENVPGAISELKKILKEYDVMINKREHYGLDYDKVDVKIT